jgi:hypothetical protein
VAAEDVGESALRKLPKATAVMIPSVSRNIFSSPIRFWENHLNDKI